MKCENCKFYDPIIDTESDVGICSLKLPPWLSCKFQNLSEMVMAYSGCDLGKPKNEQVQK